MIPAFELSEGAEVCILASDLLLATSNDEKGLSGSELRRACWDMKVYAENYIVENTVATNLSECFALARTTGATMTELDRARLALIAYPTKSLLATLIKNGCISFSLEQMSLVIADATFKSSEDVTKVRNEVNVGFDQAEEKAADEMVLEVYKELVATHAAVTFHLYETARPLPQMLAYRFAQPRPTLVLSHRLYDTAARADQLREENKVIHPAFAAREGRALAF